MGKRKLYEININIKRDDCKVSEIISKNKIPAQIVNLNIGDEETIHLVQFAPNQKNIINEFKGNSLKTSNIGRGKIVVSSPSCSACRLFAKLNTIILSEKFPDSNTVSYKILADKYLIKKIERELENERIVHEIIYKSEYETLSGLTPRQMEIVLYALINGYFDVRRRVTLNEIARNFNIKASTVDLILRRALKKIVQAGIMKKI
jgi:predicted DNA binding protein